MARIKIDKCEIKEKNAYEIELDEIIYNLILINIEKENDELKKGA